MELRYPKVAGFQLIQQIGGGGFSTVFRAVHIENHRVAACKVVTLTTETTAEARKMLDREIRLHAKLKHANVLEFFNAKLVEPDELSPYYPGLYMLLEYAAGGDLFDKIAPEVGVSEEIAHYYFIQLVAGLNYIHAEGICHRDLKPENLLLDAAGTLKISDFGLSTVYKLKDTGQTRKLSDRCGSLPYFAPELFPDGPYEAEPIDVWGSGVILFTLLTGNTPWDQPTKDSYEYSRYLSGECFDEDPWNRLSENVLSIITGILAIDPSRRMTLQEVFEHPWIIRPSQIAHHGPSAIAERLTESLRQTGDLAIATPHMSNGIEAGKDADGDQIMLSAQQSTFTQSLLLFSQTQSGRRFTPNLTRFYASLRPGVLLPLLQESLTNLEVKWKPARETEYESGKPLLQMRIGGLDRRKLKFRGWVLLEDFAFKGYSGTFCIMSRDQGNPISWRQLWKSLIMSPAVEPHVFRKREDD